MSRKIKIIDIGANLTDLMYRGIYNGKKRHVEDIDQVIQRAKSTGVTGLIITGGTLKESEEALQLAQKYDGAYCTVGCHPTRVGEFEIMREKPTMEAVDNNPDEEVGNEKEKREQLRENNARKYLEGLKTIVQKDLKNETGKIVAIGECGLDYDRLHFASKEMQRKYFEKQFEIAEETRLPMFLHNRNTEGEFVEMMRKNRSRIVGGVVHSITCSMEEMQALVDLDLYIGINGCSLKTADNLQVAAKVPIDHLMIETDCPYCEIKRTHASFEYLRSLDKEKGESAEEFKNSLWMAPTGMVRKKEKWESGCLVKGRNEPCTIRQVLRVLAIIRNEDEEVLADKIYENTLRLFTRIQG